MIAPQVSIQNDPGPPELLIAVRELLSRDPCAISFGIEALAEQLYKERYLSYRAAAHEVECAIEVLRVEGEVLA